MEWMSLQWLSISSPHFPCASSRPLFPTGPLWSNNWDWVPITVYYDNLSVYSLTFVISIEFLRGSATLMNLQIFPFGKHTQVDTLSFRQEQNNCITSKTSSIITDLSSYRKFFSGKHMMDRIILGRMIMLGFGAGRNSFFRRNYCKRYRVGDIS